MRIVIFEPDANGHQMVVVGHFLAEISRNIANVHVILLTTREAASHVNAQRVARKFSTFVTIHLAPVVSERSWFLAVLPSFYEDQWRRGEQLHRGLRQIGIDNVDFVLIPHLESVGLWRLALWRKLLHGKPWATVAHGIRFHHRKCGIRGPNRPIDVLQALFFRLVIRDPTLTCFGTVDPFLFRFAESAKVRYCLDPSVRPNLSSSFDSRAAYGIRSDTFVVLIFGFLDHRKCIGILLEAAARLRDELDLTIFLAGTQHTSLAAVLKGEAAEKLRKHESLVEVNRFIAEGEDIDPFGAADVVWVFYERDFVRNSGVLIQAGLAERPVIARQQGIVGRLVEQHELGLALTSEAPETVIAALKRLAGDPALRCEMGANGARTFAQNTPEHFAQPILDGIKAALGR